MKPMGINDQGCMLYDWTTGTTAIVGSQETWVWWNPKFFGYLAFVLTSLFLVFDHFSSRSAVSHFSFADSNQQVVPVRLIK